MSEPLQRDYGRQAGGREACRAAPRVCLAVKNKRLSPSPDLATCLGVAGSRWAGEGSSLGQSLCMGDVAVFYLFCKAFMVLQGVALMEGKGRFSGADKYPFVRAFFFPRFHSLVSVICFCFVRYFLDILLYR